jgi:Mor family transcriptional regulator|tara:strand:+ start:75 stop:227 length:153 start_codon:yes stop_codon:yes gene_type:complete
MSDEDRIKDIQQDYDMGKDIACIASVYNLTCQEVEDIIELSYEIVMKNRR